MSARSLPLNTSLSLVGAHAKPLTCSLPAVTRRDLPLETSTDHNTLRVPCTSPKWWSKPVSSARFSSGVLSAEVVYAICLPSGDHSYVEMLLGESVSTRASPPSIGTR